jgi:hypothetical protein
MHQQSTESLLGAVAKVSPPMTVLAANAAGMGLQDWVWVTAIVYTVLMTAKLIWDWLIKPNMRKREP